MSDTEIQTLGRWKSDAYKLYIEYSCEETIARQARLHFTLATCLKLGSTGGNNLPWQGQRQEHQSLRQWNQQTEHLPADNRFF